MKIAIGNDHAGYDAKLKVIEYLTAKGHEMIDCGTYSKDSCDYPIFGKACANKVASKEADYGILICSSGEGIMIAANKVRGVRAGLAYNDEVAALMREHNNANIIAFGATFMPVEDIIRRIDIFLSTPASTVARHVHRVELIEE